MDIIELQTALTTFLKTKCARSYYRKSPPNATYPYIVYDFPNSLEKYLREDLMLEIDLWDNSNLTETIDTLVGDVDGDGDIRAPTGLHRKMFYEDSALCAKLYRENRLSITDEDPRIEHRQLKYIVQTYL